MSTLLERIDKVLASGKFKSAREWCRKAGVSESYLGALRNRLQTGEVKQAKGEEIAKLANVAGVDFYWLVAGVEESEQVGKGSDDGRQPWSSDPLTRNEHLGYILDNFDWPEDMHPEQYADIARQASQEFFKYGTGVIGTAYWHTRIRRLIAEAQGRVKPLPTREPAEDVDLTQESPEVRAHRKRPKKP